MGTDRYPRTVGIRPIPAVRTDRPNVAVSMRDTPPMRRFASMVRRGAALISAIVIVGVPTMASAAGLGRPDRPPIPDPILRAAPRTPATKPAQPSTPATPTPPASPAKPATPPPFFTPRARAAISSATGDLALAVAKTRETSNIYAMSVALRDASELVDAAGVTSAIDSRIVPVERSPFLSDAILAPAIGLIVISLGLWRMAGRLPGRMGS